MNWLITNFSEFKDYKAIIDFNREYTYAELFEEIQRSTIFFEKHNINEGDVVALVSDYSFESIALFLALFQNKNIIALIATGHPADIKEKLNEAYVDKVIYVSEKSISVDTVVSSEKHKILKDIKEKKDAGLILFSSGSTGKPKAMIHNLNNFIDQYRDKNKKNMNMIVFLMFDHIGGLNTVFNILSIGATMIIPQARTPDLVCELIQKYNVKVLPASPTFLNLILMSNSHLNYNLSSLRMITYGTEPMPDSLLSRLKHTFPRVRMLQTFGTSETGIAGTSSRSSDSTFMKIDDPSLEYKIVDDELWLRSKTQILGYLNASMESFTDDGWFKTGDLVEISSDDFIKIKGRSKEVINVGGEKVLPGEIESVILEMEEIQDCIVYGEKNDIVGQLVVADVVLKSGTNILSQDAKKIIRKFCKGKLDNYKLPAKVNVVNELNVGERFKKIRKQV